MSFRIEKKLFVIPEKKLTFLEWLINSGGIKIFSDREVSSIYFDNENFQMFKESEEGIVPRKKLELEVIIFLKNQKTQNYWRQKFRLLREGLSS